MVTFGINEKPKPWSTFIHLTMIKSHFLNVLFKTLRINDYGTYRKTGAINL